MLSWSELTQMPLPPPAEKIAYDNGPQQFGELRLPKGEGRFPVVVLIHGGCWQNEFDYVYMTRLGAWFAEHGVASWTVEYRRLGDKGGGWPGTFLDVAHAADFVRQLAVSHPIDAKRVIAAGHSAGGQLALWVASRGKLAAASDLYLNDPIAIRGVLGLAAITDLAEYRHGPAGSCHASVEPLLGGTEEKIPQRYAETSPSQRLPLGLPQVFIQGERDPIVDPAMVRRYVDEAKKSGDPVTLLAIPSVGHFETSVPIKQTEPFLANALRILLP
jgi:acetyl esterase/lipase